MKRTKISAPEFGKRTGAFPNVYAVDVGNAEIIYTAGHLAMDADGNIVGGKDAASQAEYIYGLLERAGAAAGATLDDVVKTTGFITDVCRPRARVHDRRGLEARLPRGERRD